MLDMNYNPPKFIDTNIDIFNFTLKTSSSSNVYEASSDPIYKCTPKDFPNINLEGTTTVTELIRNSYCVNFGKAFIQGDYNFNGVGVQLKIASNCEPTNQTCNSHFQNATEKKLF